MKEFTTLKEFEKKLFKNPKVKKAYEDLKPEFELLNLIIKKRKKEGLTQKELARRAETKQSAISRFESGNYNPTLSFLQKIARGLGVKLKVSIVNN